MARFILALTLFACASCATTGAYVAQHPEASATVQIATAVEQCLDPAVANAIAGSWELGLASGIQCLANLVADQVLPKSLEKDAQVSLSAQLLSKQAKANKARAVCSKPAALDPNPYQSEVDKSHPLSLQAPPVTPGTAVYQVITVPEMRERDLFASSAD